MSALAKAHSEHLARRNRMAALAVPDRGIELRRGWSYGVVPSRPWATKPTPDSEPAPPKKILAQAIEPPKPPTAEWSPVWRFSYTFGNLIWPELPPIGMTVRPTVDMIINAVCSHYGVQKNEVLSQRRHLHVTRPRHVAMYLAKVHTDRSFPDIGRRFGGRDHSTVLNAVRRIEMFRGQCPELAAQIAQIELALGVGGGNSNKLTSDVPCVTAGHSTNGA